MLVARVAAENMFCLPGLIIRSTHKVSLLTVHYVLFRKCSGYAEPSLALRHGSDVLRLHLGNSRTIHVQRVIPAGENNGG